MLYIIIIVVSMLLIALGNLLALPTPTLIDFGWLSLSVFLGTVAVIAWDGVQALIIRRACPARWFSPEGKAFSVGKRERKFYRSIGINAWKDRVPELGGFTNFHKSEFSSPNDPAYLSRFLLESNYGVVIHLFNALLGPMISLLPFCASPTIALPIAAVNFVLSLAPVAVLRFNTAPLRNIYLRCLKRTNNPNG